MILGGTVAWTLIWVVLNSIQTHPLWNALRSSFIAILTADISVMLYIWSRQQQRIKPQNLKRTVITPIRNTETALNDYYKSIDTELKIRQHNAESLRAKQAQEFELKQIQVRINAIQNIQKWWRNLQQKKNKGQEFHSILTS